MHLVFGPDGGLAERRVVETPAGKTLARETYDRDGTVRLLDQAEVRSRKRTNDSRTSVG